MTKKDYYRSTEVSTITNSQQLSKVLFNYNDGGRSNYFKGTTGDCVVRAISIAAGIDYKEVYNLVKQVTKKSPRDGVDRKDLKKVMSIVGGKWTALMGIGTGCKVHLNQQELPSKGRFVLNLSGHCAAYVDGVLEDIYDCSRDGKRCVYGYWQF